MEPYAAPCRCIGRPLRFEPDRCFTCGRFLRDAIGTREPGFAHTGYLALLHAVNRKADQLRNEAGASRPSPPRGDRARRAVQRPAARARPDDRLLKDHDPPKRAVGGKEVHPAQRTPFALSRRRAERYPADRPNTPGLLSLSG
jgi:hypothetical protein